MSRVFGIASKCIELKEREKKRRRIKARKVMTSSSEEEDLYLHANKEKNNVTQRKILPIIPRRQSFISNVLHTPPFKNHKLTPKARYFTENNLNISLSNTPMSFMTKYHAQNKNLYSNGKRILIK
ncbi:hypothetical protein PUN28_003604 [Cardiocondyla obscurior]|uniref:Uncharacterized protein n=1 Tax=Cardiocondyla obscurior TaxID=286306 RepID=A0AAW2GL63_9HYME